MLAPTTLLILPPQDAMSEINTSHGPIITRKMRRDPVEKANYSGNGTQRIKIIIPDLSWNLIG